MFEEIFNSHRFENALALEMSYKKTNSFQFMMQRKQKYGDIKSKKCHIHRIQGIRTDRNFFRCLVL